MADFWNNVHYAAAMIRIPNSLGREFIAQDDFFDSEHQASMALQTAHEIVRSVVALRIYAGDHASGIPKTLAALVSGGYLEYVPKDWFACAPLRYDPKRRVVYSLGPGCRDRGGRFKTEFSQWGEADFGASIDQPPPLKRLPTPTFPGPPGSGAGTRRVPK